MTRLLSVTVNRVFLISLWGGKFKDEFLNACIPNKLAKNAACLSCSVKLRVNNTGVIYLQVWSGYLRKPIKLSHRVYWEKPTKIKCKARLLQGLACGIHINSSRLQGALSSLPQTSDSSCR